jgi:hypothetical protein
VLEHELTRSRFTRHFQYELSGHRLDSADSICDLGIVLATKLNFTSSTDSLCNRSQKTKFYEKISDAINVQLGVLQGSVLGPLLFILYINDIKNVLRYSKLNLFLDDTLLYIAADTLDEAVNRMNDDPVSLSQWLTLNKLKLNVLKMKYMVITFHKNVPVDLFKLRMGDNNLECAKHMKYLEVVIDDKLKFNKNMEMLQKKISKKINFIRKLSSKLSKYCKITLNKAITLPHLDYCSSIPFLAHNSELSYLQKLQNRMIRTILRSRLDTLIRNMLEKHNFLSVRQRVTYNTMVLLYKMEKKSAF